MNDAAIDNLGTIAANTAMRAAAEYIRINNLKVLDYYAASECLKSHCKARFSMALDHAKEAFDCGMTEIAVTTFKATMAEAGIEAAKEFAWPMNYQPN